MRKVLIVLDGAADVPCGEFGGKTPMEAACTPRLDHLAGIGRIDSFRAFSDGRIPGSENAIPALLGYPENAYSDISRGALEALGAGIQLEADDFAARCNIVELVGDGRYLSDRPAGIDPSELTSRFSDIFAAMEGLGHKIIRLGDLKALAVSKSPFKGCICIPPHESGLHGIREWRILPPDGLTEPHARLLTETVARKIRIAAGAAERCFGLWLWGGGKLPSLTPLSDLLNVKNPVMITGTPLVRGIAVAAGMQLPKVAGATGDRFTDLVGKARAAIEALRQGSEFVAIHVEAPDEAGHSGDATLKKEILERIDRELICALIEGIAATGMKAEITVTADHPTPCRLRRHTSEAVERITAII